MIDESYSRIYCTLAQIWIFQIFENLYPYNKRAVLVVFKRNVTSKFNMYTQIWQILILAKMWPIKVKENRHSWSYCGQILSPITSCRNASLRFSYWHQPLCLQLRRGFVSLKFENEWALSILQENNTLPPRWSLHVNKWTNFQFFLQKLFCSKVTFQINLVEHFLFLEVFMKR